MEATKKNWNLTRGWEQRTFCEAQFWLVPWPRRFVPGVLKLQTSDLHVAWRLRFLVGIDKQGRKEQLPFDACSFHSTAEQSQCQY